MSLKSDAATVAVCAERVLPLANASLGEEYRYQSLPLCVIDAVFSIGINYSIVKGVVRRYCAFTDQQRLRDGAALPPTGVQESISSFCKRPEQKDTERMAETVYGSTHPTSTKSGILKAEAALLFARCLLSRGVEYFQDVMSLADNPQFEADIRAIRGQKSGISLSYFWMLAGSEQLVKPDRMVLGFLSSATGRDVQVKDALPLLLAVSNLLAKKYPAITPRLLDHEIWKYQRAVKCK